MSKVINQILFLIYLILLVWIIIFKLETNMVQFLETYYFRNVNTIPYKYYSATEVFLNILIFIPFGIYIKAIFKNISFLGVIFCALLLSFSFETCQYFLAVGHSDITDLIDNTIGAFLGIVIFKIIYRIFEKDTIKTINFISITVILIFLIVLNILNII